VLRVVPPIILAFDEDISIPSPYPEPSDPLPKADVPLALRPIMLPCTIFPPMVVDPNEMITTPSKEFPEITLPDPEVVPPTKLLELRICIPLELPMLWLPVTSVPMKFPWMIFPAALRPAIEIPMLLPDIIFRVAVVVPPIVLPEPERIWTPLLTFGIAILPLLPM